MAEPIRVASGFGREFPGCDPARAEALANLIRAANEALGELDRRRRTLSNLSASGFEALAVLDGASVPLTGTDIANHLLVTTASITSLLDTLAGRGYIERQPHPIDRRKTLISITKTGRQLVDEMLPIVHTTATQLLDELSPSQLETFVSVCTHLRNRVEQLSELPPPMPRPRRRPTPRIRTSDHV
ncbi:MAG: MarR family transcriptional regulator [Actinobacteria bacterium]|nr:MarR family transcriptional regulator [Actinomycetota bacterium]